MATLGLTLALCATGGIGIALAIRSSRQRQDYERRDEDARSLYGRLQTQHDALAALREEVAELGPALIDAQRRWGFDLSRWPAVRGLVGEPSAAAVSWWLLEHAPGIGLLQDSGTATERFFSRPTFTGWVPPRLEDTA